MIKPKQNKSMINYHVLSAILISFLIFTTTCFADLIVNENGNIGIGTTEPSRLLSIEGSTNGGIGQTITNTNAGSSAYTGVRLMNEVSNFFEIGLNSNTNTTFGGASAAWLNYAAVLTMKQSGIERMRIDSSGNVGIGTTNPNSKLHLYQSPAGTDLMNIDGGYLRFSSGAFGIRNSSDFVIQTGSSNTERLRVGANGNIGIETTNLTSKLSFGTSGNNIGMDTLDGSDNKYLQLNGGGDSATEGALYSFAGAALRNAFTIAGIGADGKVPAEGSSEWIKMNATNNTYVTTPTVSFKGFDAIWMFVALLGDGYSHAWHTKDSRYLDANGVRHGYVPSGHYYKFVAGSVPYPGQNYAGNNWNNYSFSSNNCTTRFGYLLPSQYNANHNYPGQGAYWWRGR